jgi:hypothetical protein
MAIPPSGTFDYVVVVPDDPTQSSWQARLRIPIKATGDSLFDDRLVGYSPTVTVASAGMTPIERSPADRVRPKVLRSRVALTASEPAHASVASVAFYVDRALTAALQPGDVVYMASTACGGLGLSVVRNNQLAIAIGAVTAVPLGSPVQVRIPSDLITQAQSVFRTRDPKFEFSHLPLEIEVGDKRTIAFRTHGELGDYHVSVLHGFYQGIPGTNECVAISARWFCPDVVATCTAELLDYPTQLEMLRERQIAT